VQEQGKDRKSKGLPGFEVMVPVPVRAREQDREQRVQDREQRVQDREQRVQGREQRVQDREQRAQDLRQEEIREALGWGGLPD
jgi:hypothetical protein